MKTKKRTWIISLIVFLMIIPLILSTELKDDSSIDIKVKGGLICSSNSLISSWQDWNFFPPESTSSLNDCYREEGLLDKECCPSGYVCDTTEELNNGVGFRKCVFAEKYYCWNFNQNSDECKGSDNRPSVAEDSAFYINNTICGYDAETFEKNGKTCWNYTSCSCGWANNNCATKIEIKTECDNSGNIEEETQGMCEWTLTSVDNEDCSGEQGYSLFHFQGNGEDYPECTTKEVSVSCGLIAKLGFFGMFNFISTILILTLIYLFQIFIKEKR
jgi:hypothetical protein